LGGLRFKTSLGKKLTRLYLNKLCMVVSFNSSYTGGRERGVMGPDQLSKKYNKNNLK
jgi:hypothetical protein